MLQQIIVIIIYDTVLCDKGCTVTESNPPLYPLHPIIRTFRIPCFLGEPLNITHRNTANAIGCAQRQRHNCM